MRRKTRGIVIIIAALIILGLGFFFGQSAFHRIEPRLILARGAVETEGILTEKLTAETTDAPYPFTIRLFTARYTFTNSAVVVRNGEQEISKAFFETLPSAGKPIPVYYSPIDETINSVDIQPGFPGVARWRITAAGILLMSGMGMLGFAFRDLSAKD